MTTRLVPADQQGIDEAIELLRAGRVVAAPTETVYGLAARAGDPAAVARIYAAKGRPDFNPLIVHVGDVSEAETLVEVGPAAAKLMQRFWPGALTLVLPLKLGARVANAVTAGLPTLAVRCPSHPVMQALIAGAGPLAAPSANRSGALSPTRAEHVLASLGTRIPLILNDGPCAEGLESTILGIEGPPGRETVTLLRPGALTTERLGVVLAAAGSGINAPGQLAGHYAPRQPLRLDARSAGLDEYHIGFGGVRGDRSLSASGNLDEAAATLFDALHEAQASGRAMIAVAPIPERGVGVAINDRLRRAAVR